MSNSTFPSRDRPLPASSTELVTANPELDTVHPTPERRTANQDSEELLRVLFDHSPDAILLIDPHDPSGAWPIIDCNRAACQMNGYSHEELIGRPIHILNANTDTEADHADYLKRLREAGQFRLETLHRRKDGSVFPVEVSTTIITAGGRELVLGIDRDITERKRAENALRESEMTFRQSIETAGAVPYRRDHRTGRYTYMGEGIRAILGYGPDEITVEHFESLIEEMVMTGEDKGNAQPEAVNETGTGQFQIWRCDLRIRTRDGSIRWLADSSIEVTNETGTALGSIGILQDITERKKAEETLRHQNSYLAALHDTTLALLRRSDLNTLLEDILTRAAQLAGTLHGYVYLLNSEAAESEMEIKVGIGLSSQDVGMRVRPGVGVSGTVWQTGNPLVVNDYDHWAARIPTYRPGIFYSAMGVPLVSGSQVIGVIGLAHEAASGRTFGDDEVVLLTRFAQLAAVALDSARLLETERVARQRAEILQAATQALNASLDLRTVLEIILIMLKEVVPYDSASVQELHGKNLGIIGGVGFPNWDEIKGLTFDVTTDNNPNREVFETRQPFILNDVTASRFSAFQSELHAAIGIRSWLGVPLLFGERVLGMITLDKKEPNFYTETHARVALAFAAQAVIAINNARMYTAVQEHAAESAALYHASAQLLNPGADLVGLAEQIVQAVIREFALSNCRILLIDKAGTGLQRIAAAGDFQVANVETLTLEGPGLTVSAARSGEMVYASDVLADPRYLAGDSRTRSELVMPLKNQDRVIGVLDLQSPEPDAFDERARRIIAAFAQHAGLALENARLVVNLEQAYRKLQEDQEQLLAAEKMASLGRLTAGIAHEMNTPLAAVRFGLTEINNLIEEYQTAVGDPEVTLDDHRAVARDMQNAVRLANSAAEQAAAFVRSVKAQTRDLSPGEHVRFKVVPLINDTLLLLSHALRHGQCTVTVANNAGDAELLGSPGRLAQVVTNLVTNAIDASAARGGGLIQIQLTHTATSLDLCVRDSGGGIPPELLTKIFEPMFTTKPFGQGTGLGLTIIRDIVTGDFGGTLEVASELGQGAAFTVHFPRLQEIQA